MFELDGHTRGRIFADSKSEILSALINAEKIKHTYRGRLSSQAGATLSLIVFVFWIAPPDPISTYRLGTDEPRGPNLDSHATSSTRETVPDVSKKTGYKTSRRAFKNEIFGHSERWMLVIWEGDGDESEDEGIDGHRVGIIRSA